MSKTIEFYFDIGSPTAYLAHLQLPKIAAQYQAELVYKPFLLGGVFKATNNSPPAMVPAKGLYLLQHDLPRYVELYGVEFTMNPHFPVNTLYLMRAAIAAQELACFEVFVETMFQHMWAKGSNLGDIELVKHALEEAGINATQLLELAASEQIKEQLKHNTNEAVERGCFGAPTMFIGDEMFFGQDRLDFIERALARG